jgi:hypothetical protein
MTGAQADAREVIVAVATAPGRSDMLLVRADRRPARRFKPWMHARRRGRCLVACARANCVCPSVDFHAW